jgi:hypothetical protein
LSATDFHATLLHQLGLDPEVLTHQVNNQPLPLIEPAQGKVVDGILA